MPDILLVTANARYIHSAFGLRYLLANMGELRERTGIREYVIQTRALDIVEDILRDQPAIVGFGVYIWNVELLTQVVSQLKRVSPHTAVILGGPEVSFESEEQIVVAHADYVICGQADLAFAALCRRLLAGESVAQKVITAPPPPLADLRLPYGYYSDDDIAHRVVYVEASRGCPYKCEFCLSALDKTVWSFELDAFLGEMALLHQRGVRHFKFVDRTFNLKIDAAIRILEFFLRRLDDDLFLHFELVPDHLPDRLRAAIARFPPGSLQLEIGIQTFNPRVQTLINRRQDEAKTIANIAWLRRNSHAHLHADLILGLPAEDIESIGRGFDRLIGLQPQEIQVGILKRLRGSPITRHTRDWAMVYNPFPPYNVLSTGMIDFPTMQRLSRFARYWDMIGNSGRFAHTLPLLLADAAFKRFMTLSDWLYARTGQTHRIALDRLFDLLHDACIGVLKCDPRAARDSLWLDFQRSGSKKHPHFAPPP